jgi:hypothetical protein
MRVLVLSVAIIIAGFLSGGVYQITGTGTVGGMAVLNRFTGSVWGCDPTYCSPVRYRTSD